MAKSTRKIKWPGSTGAWKRCFHGSRWGCYLYFKEHFRRPQTRRINNVDRCGKVCRSSRIDEVHYACSDTAPVTSDERQEDSVEAVPMFVGALNSHSTAWRVDLQLLGANVSFKIDTGADVSVSRGTLNKVWSNVLWRSLTTTRTQETEKDERRKICYILLQFFGFGNSQSVWKPCLVHIRCRWLICVSPVVFKI